MKSLEYPIETNEERVETLNEAIRRLNTDANLSHLYMKQIMEELQKVHFKHQELIKAEQQCIKAFKALDNSQTSVVE